MATQLDKDTLAGIDITSFVQVSSYTNNTGRTLVVAAQVQITPVAAGGAYALRTFLDSDRVAPDSNVVVPTGSPSAAIQSRELILDLGVTLTVQILGLSGDTSVDTVAIVVDTGPLTASDLYGSQGIVVDHDYSGTDTYRVVDSEGAGISGVDIVFYLKSDYDAGDRGQAFIKARSTTGVDGRWREPVQLEAATYVTLFSKASEYQTASSTIIVS